MNREIREETDARCVPPRLGMLKFNVDGTFDRSNFRERWYIGIVVRNDTGEIHSMRAIPVPRATSAEMVEAMDYRSALEFVDAEEGRWFK